MINYIMKNKIIYIYYPSFEKGGIAKILIKLINFLLKRNFKIKLYSQNVSKNNFLHSKKLTIINLNKIKKINKSYLQRFFLTFHIAKKLYLDIQKENEKAIIVSMQDHIMSIIVSIFTKKRILIRNSEEIYGATKFSDNKIIAKSVLLIKKILYQYADTIIVNSTSSRNSMKSIINDKKKVKLIFNPYLEKILPYYKKRKGKDFLILSAGRLTKQKNFEMLIETVKKLKKDGFFIQLIIIGSGPEGKKLNEMIKNFDYIKLNKWSKKLKFFFSNANLFILPSFYEGSPNILLDAANNNVPILSSNCSGAKDILKNNKKYIFEINNLNQLKKKIIDVILNYKDAIKKTKINKINIKKFTSKNLNLYLKEINLLYEKKN